ncbi:hypothetical protein L3Q82_004938 [Scortum barcoo]|uniref:Uncharacterized protein n=1 Tax=Scortum barcoo TaxID=214431 RepID=A0ACB8VDZ7_9TELE|nr:hypothetical protein L3Q82_004938 [Scortum barcoo]
MDGDYTIGGVFPIHSYTLTVKHNYTTIPEPLRTFNIPQIIGLLFCFRTIPSNQFQAEALAKLVKHFGWTWIGAVRSDSDYGNNGMASFLKAAQKEGICVEYSVSFHRNHPLSRIQSSTAVVVVAFVASGDMRILLEELSREPSPPRQWIGSDLPTNGAVFSRLQLKRLSSLSRLGSCWHSSSNCPILRDSLWWKWTPPVKGLDQVETPLARPSEIERLKQEYEQLQQAQAEARHVLKEQMKTLGTKISGTVAVRERKVHQPTPITAPEVTVRKDFRIWGQIGEAGKKDKLSFTSLTNQIESGLKKGYSETDIIEAMIKAVSPGLHFRDLLEVKRDLTLPTLRTILRGHYKVDSSSDLLHRLMNISQDTKESAQGFLYRAIKLRQKLLWKLGDEDEGEEFSPDLIQRKFLRSLETGLLSEAVKFQLKPHLSNPRVMDEVLIEKINEASSLEKERQNKLRRNIPVKPPRVNEIYTELQADNHQLPLKSDTDTTKLNATGHRWVGELADFNFTIRYLPGRKNADANDLSRLPLDINQYMAQCTAKVKQDVMGAVAESTGLQRGSNLPETTVVSQSAISLVQDTTPLSARKSLSQGDIRGSQEQDAVIGRFLQHRANDYLPKGRALKAEPSRCLCQCAVTTVLQELVRIDARELRFSRAMVFAIEEINNSTELLPGIKLGYLIHDSCASVPVAVHVAFQLSNGLDPVFYTGDNCSQSGMVMAVVGEPLCHMSTAVVIVAFAASGDLMILLEELSREPSPPRQWIGSEAWVTNPDMLKFSSCAGAVGFGLERSVIPGAETDQRVCDGTEDIKTLQNPYTDTSQLRITNMVYKAVYAIAHAIHNAVYQKTNSTNRIELQQVLNQLKKVNFSRNGYDVSFDANGDPVARYELVNWQKSESGRIELVTVGHYDASLPAGKEFRINKNLIWVDGGTQVPVSVCSDSCPLGTRKVLQKGKPICCYDCVPCPEAEISNFTELHHAFPPRNLQVSGLGGQAVDGGGGTPQAVNGDPESIGGGSAEMADRDPESPGGGSARMADGDPESSGWLFAETADGDPRSSGAVSAETADGDPESSGGLLAGMADGNPESSGWVSVETVDRDPESSDRMSAKMANRGVSEAGVDQVVPEKEPGSGVGQAANGGQQGSSGGSVVLDRPASGASGNSVSGVSGNSVSGALGW